MAQHEEFSQCLRDEARVADRRAAEASEAGPDVANIAFRNTYAGTRLRALAANIAMTTAERAALEEMSPEEMRVLAQALRLTIGREGDE